MEGAAAVGWRVKALAEAISLFGYQEKKVHPGDDESGPLVLGQVGKIKSLLLELGVLWYSSYRTLNTFSFHSF